MLPRNLQIRTHWSTVLYIHSKRILSCMIHSTKVRTSGHFVLNVGNVIYQISVCKTEDFL